MADRSSAYAVSCHWAGPSPVIFQPPTTYSESPKTAASNEERGSGIGGSFDTAFSPGFLDPEFPGASVIKGSFFEQLDNGGYFDFDPGTAENGGSVLIAQFTIASGTTASYEATVDHVLAGQSGVTSVAMGTVVIPAPGVTALLGLAGLAGTRRRRVVAVRR